MTITDSLVLEAEDTPLFPIESFLLERWRNTVYDSLVPSTNFSNPFYYGGFIFVPSSTNHVFDADSGEKIIYGSDEGKQKLRKLGGDTLIAYNNLKNLSSVVINVISGEKIYEAEKQPISKAPYVVKKGQFFYTSRAGEQRMLNLWNIYQKRTIWSTPFEKFGFSKSVQSGDFLLAGDSEYLKLIDIDTGALIWSINLKVIYLNGDLEKGIVYAATSDGLYFIDLVSIMEPSIKWKLESSDDIMDVIREQGRLYIQKRTSLLAFDVRNKKILWKANWYFDFGLNDQITICNGVIVTCNVEHDRYNLFFDKDTGRLLSSGMEDLISYSFSKSSQGNVVFGTSNEGAMVYRIEIKME
ncbi:MAG: hypothetical protein KF860_17275 [Cyclobacteriaceae bacterium]|nr:hypothetical protein [Cyclobacteriaceae bacterium]